MNRALLFIVMVLPHAIFADDLVVLIRESQKAVVSLTESMSCKFTEANYQTNAIIENGEYVHVNNICYINRSPVIGDKLDIWITNSKKTIVAIKNGVPVHATIAATNEIQENYVLSSALLSFYGPDGIRLTFDELLNGKHVVEKAMIDPENINLAYVKVRHEKAQLEFWFDATVNYLVRRHRMIIPESKFVDQVQEWEMQVLNFKTTHNAAYFPDKVVTTCKQGKKVMYETITSFTNINMLTTNAIHKKIPMRLPIGIPVYDGIAGKSFKVSQDGTLIPTPQIEMTSASPLSAVKEGEIMQTQTKPHDLQSDWFDWLMYLSVIVVLIGLIGIMSVRIKALRK